MINAPNAYEFDADVNRECLFGQVALLPTLPIFTRIHFVSERDLLVVAWRQKPDLSVVGENEVQVLFACPQTLWILHGILISYGLDLNYDRTSNTYMPASVCAV